MRTPIPKQPNTFVSYWNVGLLLHCSLILFLLETLFYWNQLKSAYYHESHWVVLWWLSCVLFAFSHIFLVIMDAWSRFQNYKRVKDHLFIHGFTPQIAKHYRGSKCQRHAVIVAARELGLEKEVRTYYQRHGIKWFHFIPQFMVKDPFFLFKRYFWSRTFMEKYYEPKFNYHQLYQEISHSCC